MVAQGDRSTRMCTAIPVLLSAMLSASGLAWGADDIDRSIVRRFEFAQCAAIGLTDCPQPFDAVLPPAEDMLSWDQRSRVIGFRNTYRL
jgi:hypothetical protein